MKAWVYRKDREDSGIHIFQEDAPMPDVGHGQILLRVDKVSVCATDESVFRGDLKRVPDGMIPGHEFYGEIVAIGPGVKGLRTGQMVAGESHYQILGSTEPGIIGLWAPETANHTAAPLHGAYAEFLTIPAECAYPVPSELVSHDFWPSLFEAIGNDYFLIKRLRRLNKTEMLGVFGCGPHGLFAQVFARHFGIPKIAAFEIDEYRRTFASNMGVADHIMNPAENLLEKTESFTGGKYFDATIDMVGKQGQGFQACCETTRDGGTILLFGLFTDRFALEGVPGNEIIFKMKQLKYSYKGKSLNVLGITGREGIWLELIDTVSNNKQLQSTLMKPVSIMGSLDKLGEDTRSPQSGILKRAYHAFPGNH